MSLKDAATAVRSGEELDIRALHRFLAEKIPEVKSDLPIAISQFPGGHSNLTYLIEQADWQGVVRRPPVGSKVKSAHDMGREYRVLSRLGPAYALAPTPLAYCEEDDVLGCPFYVMERISGFILRKQFPEELEPTPELLGAMCDAFAKTLADLHAVDYEAIGLGELGRPEGYAKRQVEGWTRRYHGAKTDDIEAVDRVATWLSKNIPDSEASALIHNDFKFDNLVLDPSDPTVVRGILDWEMTTLGDPLMDLGGALGYWVQANDPPALHTLRFAPTHLPGMFTRQELAEAYADATGASLEHILFYYVFGLFKSLVIVQQIYYRFHKGLTKDKRFAKFIHAVGILSEQAQTAIAQDRL